jgi:hypothetical protein
MPPSVNESNAHHYRKSKAVTEKGRGRPGGALAHIDHQNCQVRQVPPILGLLG